VHTTESQFGHLEVCEPNIWPATWLKSSIVGHVAMCERSSMACQLVRCGPSNMASHLVIPTRYARPIGNFCTKQHGWPLDNVPFNMAGQLVRYQSVWLATWQSPSGMTGHLAMFVPSRMACQLVRCEPNSMASQLVRY
jgi:hypothetical protein